MKRSILFASLLLAVLTLSSCGGSSSPAGIIESYYSALIADEYEKAARVVIDHSTGSKEALTLNRDYVYSNHENEIQDVAHKLEIRQNGMHRITGYNILENETRDYEGKRETSPTAVGTIRVELIYESGGTQEEELYFYKFDGKWYTGSKYKLLH